MRSLPSTRFATHELTVIVWRAGSTNILWDREKQQVTGIVDFEWAHTAGMADEWFYSFGQEGGMFNGKEHVDI